MPRFAIADHARVRSPVSAGRCVPTPQAAQRSTRDWHQGESTAQPRAWPIPRKMLPTSNRVQAQVAFLLLAPRSALEGNG